MKRLPHGAAKGPGLPGVYRKYAFTMRTEDVEGMLLCAQAFGKTMEIMLCDAVHEYRARMSKKKFIMLLELNYDIMTKANTVGKALGFNDGQHWVETSIKNSIHEAWETMFNMAVKAKQAERNGNGKKQVAAPEAYIPTAGEPNHDPA